MKGEDMQPDEQRVEIEKALAEAARGLAAELRLTDIVDLITFIRTENHPNLSDLVNSSAELYFKPGTLAYGWAADVELRWTSAPIVRFDLEFRHRDVTAFFDLILEPRLAGIELKHVAYEAAGDDRAGNARRLLDAVADARLPEGAAATA